MGSPSPASARVDLAAPEGAPGVPGDALTCDALTATFRVLQRRGGHRFSVDDRMTAWVAARLAQARSPRAPAGAPLRVLDLGTGIGSVLLMVAWAAPDAELVGVEAQAESHALLVQNVERNGVAGRARLLHGDLRERVPELPARSFDLVTGTPPYLPPGTATPSPDAQRAAARIELRGGIEAYLAAAAHAVAPEGRVVVCADGRTPERTRRAAAAAGLDPREALHVVPREGAGPLFTVWTLAPAGQDAAPSCDEATHVQRDARGERTPASREVLALFGL